SGARAVRGRSCARRRPRAGGAGAGDRGVQEPGGPRGSPGVVVANGETLVEHRLDAEGADPLMLAGVNDRNIQEVARIFGIRVVLRGDHVILSGTLPGVEGAVPVVQHMIELARMRAPFDVDDIARFAAGVE